MAIAFDNAVYGGLVNPSSSQTYAYTVGTGSNRILFVGVVANVSITGVTYGGMAMTFISSSQNGSDLTAYLYYLIAPASGSNNVIVSAGSSGVILSGAVSYSGASQTGVPDASHTAIATGVTSWSDSVTTVADNSWAIAMIRENVGRSATVGANTNNRVDGGGHGFHMVDGGPKTPAGSFALNISSFSGVSLNTADIMASFAPYVTPAGPANLKTWNGLAKASIKTIDGLAIGSVKTIDGLA